MCFYCMYIVFLKMFGFRGKKLGLLQERWHLEKCKLYTAQFEFCDPFLTYVFTYTNIFNCRFDFINDFKIVKSDMKHAHRCYLENQTEETVLLLGIILKCGIFGALTAIIGSRKVCGGLTQNKLLCMCSWY